MCNIIHNQNYRGREETKLLVVVRLVTSVQGVPGYGTITGTTPAPASLRCLSYGSLIQSSVFLAVVESGRRKGSESFATVQGLGKDKTSREVSSLKLSYVCVIIKCFIFVFVINF